MCSLFIRKKEIIYEPTYPHAKVVMRLYLFFLCLDIYGNSIFWQSIKFNKFSGCMKRKWMPFNKQKNRKYTPND